MSGFLPTEVAVLGLVVGLLYALLAMGFVLVYKSTRVLNMAHGDIGGFGSVLLVYASLQLGLGFWPSFVLAIGVGAAVGGLVESRFIRRLSSQPRVVVLVATLGLAQLIVAVNSLIISPRQQAELLGSDGFPEPFSFSIRLLGTTIRPAAILTLVLVPIVVGALTVFLQRSRFGIAMRAVAENADNARLLGASAARVSLVAWMIGGGLSALAAVLIGANTGSASTVGIGPALLVRALAPAMAAALVSLPRAAIWGIVLGFVEQVILFNTQNAGLVDGFLLAFILLVLLLRRQAGGRAGALDDDAWPIANALRALPQHLARGSLNLRLRQAVIVGVAVLAIGVPFISSGTTTVIFIRVVGFAIAGVSLTVLTGFGGQVSLGQWAVAGVGGIAAARVDVAFGWPVWATLLVASTTGAGVSILVGIPALRLRGLLLAVTTLAFAVAASGYLFQVPWFVTTPAGIDVARPAFIASNRAMYLTSLAVLCVAALVARQASTGRLGRLISAVRENERTAQAAGLDVVGIKLTTFAIAGAIAGLGGWLAVYADGIGNRSVFEPSQSLLLVMASVLGGIGTIAGPIIGCLLVFGLPALFPNEAFIATLGTGIGVLSVLSRLPAGVVSLPYKLRNALVIGLVPGRATHFAPALAAPPPATEPVDDATEVLV